MNLSAMPMLALVLFAPWFLILGGLYWLYPRQPRHAARTRFDVLALGLAVVGCLASLHWSFEAADRSHGHLWPQVLATSVGYGVFLAVLATALLLRRRVLARGRTTPGTKAPGARVSAGRTGRPAAP